MSTLVSVENFPEANRKELGRVDFDAAAAQAVIKFVSVQGLVANDVVFVGRLGTESAERLVVQSIAGFNVTFTTNLTKDHRRFQPIVALRGDQIKIYRAPNVDGHQPADSEFALMSGMPTTIDYDQPSTFFEDSDGTDEDWYKATYYHSLLSTETDLAQSKAVRGGGHGHYAKLSDIRAGAGFKDNQNITDAMVNAARLKAEAEINTSLAGFFTLPFSEPISPKIREITELLGAGRLLNDEYGPFNSGGTSKRGQSKLDEGRALLEQIRTGDSSVLDETLTSLRLEGSLGISSWPNNDTADTESADGGGKRMFRVGGEY